MCGPSRLMRRTSSATVGARRQDEREPDGVVLARFDSGGRTGRARRRQPREVREAGAAHARPRWAARKRRPSRAASVAMQRR